MRNLKKTLLTLSLPLVCFSFLTSCSQRTLDETFVSYISDDESLTLSVQASIGGGNGKALIEGQLKDFYWDLYKEVPAGMWIYIYIPDLNEIEEMLIESIKIVGSRKKSSETIRLVPFSSGDNEYFKENISLHKQELQEGEINAKNFFNCCFKNEVNKMTITMSFTPHENRSLREMKWKTQTLDFFFMEGDTFRIRLGPLRATGTYVTAKANVILQFETDEIFDLDESSVLLDVVDFGV